MQHGLGLGSSPSNSSGKAKMGALKVSEVVFTHE